MIRKISYLIYRLFFRFTPNSFRPYALFFPWIRRFFAESFLTKCGRNVNIEYGCDFSLDIELGDYSSLGDRCIVQSGCVIGNNVMMGPDVKIYTRGHEFSDCSVPMRLQGNFFFPVVIGDDVWIGANVVILPNVSIGNHVIIGAGAIVTQSVPDFAVVGGNPARVLKFRNRVQEDMLEEIR